MSRADHQRIPTVSDAVREAISIADPNGTDTAVSALYDGFEDDDRPVTAAANLTGELLGTVRAIDPEGDEPAALAAAAGAVWLSVHPDQADRRDHVLREGIRLVFKGRTPEPLLEWLGERGIET